MKTILIIIAVLFGLTVFTMLAPAIIGIGIGILLISDGSVIGGILSIVIGVGTNIAMGAEVLDGSGSTYSGLDDCPYCGGGDSDGNHCYTCDEDF